MKDAAYRVAVLDSRPSPFDLRRILGVGVGLLMVAAAVLGWRRLAGALDTPLQASALLGLAAATAGAALTIRLAWRSLWSARGLPVDQFVWLCLSASVLTIGIALSLPGSSAVGLVALWTILALEECWAWLPSARHAGAGGSGPWLRIPRIGKFFTGSRYRRRRILGAGLAALVGWRNRRSKRFRVDPAESPSPHGVTELDESPAADVTQQLVRSQAVDGGEMLAGWLRVGLAPGQRIASVHVAFCPPFARTPTLSVEQLDGPPGRLKTVQLLPYGARFDLKLSRPCEEEADALLGFSAASANESE